MQRILPVLYYLFMLADLKFGVNQPEHLSIVVLVAFLQA